MKKNYDIVFVTHMPVFYKVNLYNEIAKHKDVFVFFVADDTRMKRGPGFYSLENAAFDYELLWSGEFENRNKLKTVYKLYQVIKEISFKQIIVGGWDLLEFWLVLLMVPKRMNSLALESTVFDSKSFGLVGIVKKIFLSRIAKVYASGYLHVALLKALNYKGDIEVTNGVGIIRKPKKIIYKKENVFNRIVFIGRLSNEKNLNNVIEVVNGFPWLQFDIYGIGPQESELKNIAKGNVNFNGVLDNESLENVFSTADYLILPSKKEPWGLVCEEANYFSTPVIMSSRCGSADIIRKCDGNVVLHADVFKEELKDFLKSYHVNIVDGEAFINDKDKAQIGSYV